MWSNVNTTMKIILGVAFLVVVLVLANRLQCNRPTVPTNAGSTPEVHPAISEAAPGVPAPREVQGGILEIRHKPKPTPENPHPKIDTIKVYLPKEPREQTPTVVLPDDAYWDTTTYLDYTPIREPLLEFEPHVLIGASVDPSSNVSPLAGVELIRGFGMVGAGLGLDLYGAGPVAGVEVFRDFHLGALYRIVGIKKSPEKLSFTLMYRF